MWFDSYGLIPFVRRLPASGLWCCVNCFRNPFKTPTRTTPERVKNPRVKAKLRQQYGFTQLKLKKAS